jgi:hypothetical protein
MSVMSVRQPVSSFERQSLEALKRLRTALASLIESIPGDIRRAADLERTLSIRKTLAWQIFKISHSHDPLSHATKLPGQFAMDRFLEAAAAAGATAKRIEAVRKALRQHGNVVQIHAGDRTTFDTMVSGISNGSSAVELGHRRAAFKANSHILGLQADAHLVGVILSKARRDDMVDVIAVRGYVGLRRLRPNAKFFVAQAKITDDHDRLKEEAKARAIDVEAFRETGVPLLAKFCSRPFPEFRSNTSESGFQTVEIAGGEIGNKTSSTYFTAESFIAAVPRYVCATDHMIKAAALVRVPQEVLIHDVFVQSGLFPSIAPKRRVYSDVNRQMVRDLDESVALGEDEPVMNLGAGLDLVQTPAIPHYAELLQEVFDRVQFDPRDFIGHRSRVEYPVVPSSDVIQFELPERPAP